MNIENIEQHFLSLIFILLTLNNKIGSQSLSLASNYKSFYKNSSENIKSHETTTYFDTKIHGGTPTQLKQILYFASLRIIERDNINYGDGHFCGGTLIKVRTILTSASCLYYQYPDGGRVRIDPKEMVTVMGSNTRIKKFSLSQTRKVNKTIPHKEFHYRTLRHDIGLVIVERDFTINSVVDLLEMATIVNHKDNDMAYITGYGKTIKTGNQSEVLIYTAIPIKNHNECLVKYGYVQIITKTVLCAGSGSAFPCLGDRGGPLVKDNKLYGIISYGLSCDNDYPGLYTLVPYYQDWIARGSGTKNYLNIALIFIFFYTSFIN